MSQHQIDIIKAQFKNRSECLWFWFCKERGASNGLLASRSGLKNANVVASIISRGQWRKP